MGREIRKVTKDWCHPKNDQDGYKPLYEGYKKDAAFIVKAVNNHYQLLGLLQKIADLSDSIPLADMPTPLFNLIENELREAIKQAEAE